MVDQDPRNTRREVGIHPKQDPVPTNTLIHTKGQLSITSTTTGMFLG